VITGIVVALPEELTTLTSKKIDKRCCSFITDKLLVAYSGAGHVSAKSASELLVAKGATRLISWGCAAALCSSLKPGDLILAAFAVVHTGRLAESISIVSSIEDKQQLQSITGAVALDMESIAIARIAKQHALPFLSIRVIADPVNMNLPQAINYSLNDQGEVVLGKLLLFLFLHPAELPGLIKLGLHFNAARKTLKLVAKHLDTVTGFNNLNATTL
jgi:nucleoside phosphorylase